MFAHKKPSTAACKPNAVERLSETDTDFSPDLVGREDSS